MKIKDLSWVTTIWVLAITLSPLLLFTTYFSWAGVWLCLASFALRGFAITAIYHRYFAHKSYEMGRVMQALMAFLGATAAQHGPLWWAAAHRHHHMYSDQPGDLHSPRLNGFWYSHIGWLMVKGERFPELIKDFAKYPELRWLDKYHPLMVALPIVALWLFSGWHAAVWGGFLPLFFVGHLTWAINSLTHVFGKARYETGDDSKNHWLLALLTFGEGWHNNHHRFAGSARQGFAWYEVDLSYYVLKLLSWLRLVRNLRPVPEAILIEGGLRSAPVASAAQTPAAKATPSSQKVSS